MSEATIQNLTTPLTGEEPFIGDGSEGELITNTADGRVWAFDQTGIPIELGGACVNKPVAPNLFVGNYIDLDITNPDNLPIPNPDPLTTAPGFCRELKILLRFSQAPIGNITTYWDYPVSWGESELWNPLATPGVTNPIDLYSAAGSLILVELNCFGPSPSWMGRVVWANKP